MFFDFRSHLALRVVTAVTIASGALILAGTYTSAARVGILAGLAVIFVRWGKLIAPAFRGTRRRAHLGLIAVVAATIAATLLLAHSGTTVSIRSPWSIVPNAFGLLVAVAAAATLLLAFRNEVSSSVGTGIVLFVGSLVAVLIYRLGFGFDHFLHVATEQIIAETGTLSPRPFFYSGYYGLVTLIAMIPGISMDIADRLLVPAITALLLPPLALRTLRAVTTERGALLGTCTLLIVPFLPLAVSTPQALANAFTLATVLALIAEGRYGGSSWNWRSWSLPCMTALAALVSQPMSGIIAAAMVIAAMCIARRWRIGAAFACLTDAIAIPIAFALAPLVAPGIDIRVAPAVGAALERLVVALTDALSIVAVDFSSADALTIARVLLPLAWIGLAIAGYRALRRSPPMRHLDERDANFAAAIALLAPHTALAASVIVAATVTVPTQLAEEQSQFPIRLLALAALLAMPLAGVGFGTLCNRIRTGIPRAAVALTFGVAAAFTLLLAYPRDDAQARSGLWSVSASDIAAVHAIAEDAGDARYVVLANQMLGAAAVREFGFRPSFLTADHGEVMAFPLPAGGPIARAFWEHVSQDPALCFSPSSGLEEEREGVESCPNRVPINDVMNLVGADRAYVVLHEYWRNYPRLVEATATIADAEIASIPNLRVFRFTRAP